MNTATSTTVRISIDLPADVHAQLRSSAPWHGAIQTLGCALLIEYATKSRDSGHTTNEEQGCNRRERAAARWAALGAGGAPAPGPDAGGAGKAGAVSAGAGGAKRGNGGR